MSKNRKIYDCKGVPVHIGSKVKVLKVPEYLLSELPDEEVKNLKSMIGEILTVYEIDEYGGAWVDKCFKEGDDSCYNHCLSLAADEMQVVK